MSWEALTALATVFSAVVVAIAALAAVLQIRHLRAGNQIEAILRIYDTFNSAEMMAARRYCFDELPAVLEDPEARQRIADGSVDPRLSLFGNFLNEIGGLVVDGFLDERPVWPLFPQAARLWLIVEPTVRAWRRRLPHPVWADFEYIAELEKRVDRERHLARFPRWFRDHIAASDAGGAPSVPD